MQHGLADNEFADQIQYGVNAAGLHSQARFCGRRSAGCRLCRLGLVRYSLGLRNQSLRRNPHMGPRAGAGSGLFLLRLLNCRLCLLLGRSRRGQWLLRGFRFQFEQVVFAGSLSGRRCRCWGGGCCLGELIRPNQDIADNGGNLAFAHYPIMVEVSNQSRFDKVYLRRFRLLGTNRQNCSCLFQDVADQLQRSGAHGAVLVNTHRD